MISDQYKDKLKLFVFLIGALLLIKGLMEIKHEYELTPLILFLCLFPISLLIAIPLKLNAIKIGSIYLITLVLLSGNISSILIVLIIVFSAYILGNRICNFLKITEVDPSIKFLIGIGLFGTIIGLAAHFPIAYPATYSFLLLAPFVGLKNLKGLANSWIGVLKLGVNGPMSPIYLTQIGIATCISIYFIYSLLPELGYDALVYHLFIPAQMASLHKWGFDVEKYIWAVFPLLGDWIFSLTYVLSGEVATRFINFFFILIGARIIFLLSKELGLSTIGQYLCIAVYFSNPLTFAMSSTLYVESIWGAYFMSATLIILKLFRSPSKDAAGNFVLLALVFGFSAAAKMATLVLSPLILFITILSTPVFEKKNRLAVIFSTVLFLIIATIPNITAWAKTKNPFFPILNNIFTSPLFPSFNFTPPHLQPLDWNTLFEITFNTGKFLESSPGGIGFHLIFFTPVIFLAALWFGKENKKFLALLVICTLGIISIFITTTYVRYAYPLFTMLCICVVACTEIIKPSKNLLIIFRITIIMISVFNLIFLNSGAWNYRNFSFLVIFSKEEQKKYLLQMNSLRIAVQAVNELNINNDPVACFTQPLLAGLKSTALIPNWYNEKFQSEILEAKDSNDVAKVLKKHNVNYVILQKGAPIFNLSNNLWDQIINSTAPVSKIGTEIIIRSIKD
jgi:hypothetical protein